MASEIPYLWLPVAPNSASSSVTNRWTLSRRSVQCIINKNRNYDSCTCIFLRMHVYCEWVCRYHCIIYINGRMSTNNLTTDMLLCSAYYWCPIYDSNRFELFVWQFHSKTFHYNWKLDSHFSHEQAVHESNGCESKLFS